ncbi:hypothetical protein, partial [Ralstonia solanacearum]
KRQHGLTTTLIYATTPLKSFPSASQLLGLVRMAGGTSMKEEYSYLWDGSSNAWALLHVNSKDKNEVPRYLIVNIETRKSLLISDDVVYEQVKQLMLDRGVRIVTVGNGF